MDTKFELQAEALIHKIKHYLITVMGVTVDEASSEEFYRAFALTIREEIMVNWTATNHTYRKKQVRTLYYLCMEYMPGRLMGSNITSIHATHLVMHVMKMMNRNYQLELQFESEPGLGNGGLGRLASCLLDSLATQQYPAVGYGLRYQYGTFDQEIWDGVQIERPENWLLHENPWEFRRDIHAYSIFYSGRPVSKMNKKQVETYDLVEYEEVRALAYDIPIIGYQENGSCSVNTLRIWTTKESPRNFKLQRYNAGLLDQAAENTSLTDVLYPNDNNEMGKRVRLKQEFLLVSASLQDIIYHYAKTYADMKQFSDKVRIHMNETHAALVTVELMRMLIHDYNYEWKQAFETMECCCNYTNHTILRESLEEWNQNRVHSLLPRQYQIIERLNLELCTRIRAQYPGDEERVQRMSIIEAGQVRMAHLAIYGSHHVNGVAPLHSEILQKVLFKDFFTLSPEKFTTVTNGVTQRRWILHCNPRLAHFISRRIGKEWITDFTRIKQLAEHAEDSATREEFLKIKRENKQDFFKFLKENNPLRDFQGAPIGYDPILGEDALLAVQIKRIHEYKRQFMNVLHAIMLYHELKDNPNARKIKRMIVIAGKAAPGYSIAKNIIYLICCVARKINNDPAVNKQLNLIFMENYNVSHAEKIIPAAELSEQLSTAGTEASGTGNMKLAMNGALTIGTEDGATIEMHQQITDQFWPFGFGKKADENAALRSHYNPGDIYIHNPAVNKAVESLRDHSFAETESEHQNHLSLYHVLLEGQNGEAPDFYFVLSDLMSYYDTQKKVEELYLQPNEWARYALHNMAAMGRFSSDETAHHYAKIWEIEPCPVDRDELARVRDQYSEHDKCRIL